jgi:hypothetical protein
VRSEHDERRQRETGDDELHLREVVAVDDRVRELVVTRRLFEQVVDELQDEPEDHRADDRPLHPREAPEDDDREREEREGRPVLRRLCRLLLGREHESTEGADEAADAQALHLVREDVLAEAAPGVFVLADALQNAPPRAAHDQEHREGRDRDE